MEENDNDVQIRRQKRMLATIRSRQQQDSEGENHEPKQSGSGVSERYAQGRNSINGGGAPVGDGDDTGDTRRQAGTTGTQQRPSETDGAASRLYSGVRQTDRPGINTDKGSANGDRRDTRERAKQQRVTDEQKPPIDFTKARFQLRNPFSKMGDGSAQLFTKAEAEAELERMTEIYFRGSGLIDDILQITVKGHEEVQIWQLDEEEARTLAEMHLARAQHDKRSAASARQLLALYDRLYFWLLVGPRAKMTYEHVKEHGGFSFR